MNSKCSFVRKNCSGWEYGHIEVTDHATKFEKRKHIVVGKAASYEEACHANSMSLNGKPRGHHFDHNARPFWKE